MLVFRAQVKFSCSDCLGYLSEKGSEAEPRPRVNKCGNCLARSASLALPLLLYTGPRSPCQGGSPGSGPSRPRPGSEGTQAFCSWASLARLPSRHLDAQLPPEPLIWVLLPHAPALGHLSPVSLPERTFILGPRTAGAGTTWSLPSLLGQHLPSLAPGITGAAAKGEQWGAQHHVAASRVLCFSVSSTGSACVPGCGGGHRC